MSCLWLLIDGIVSRLIGIEPLREGKACILSIQLRRHRGQPVQLGDNTIISPGDPLAELHMNNKWFQRNGIRLSASTGEERWRVSAAFSEDLRYLADRLVEGHFFPEVRALHAKTLLRSPAQRLGFMIVEIPQGLGKRSVTFYLKQLRLVYHFRKDKKQAIARRPSTLVEVWMSRAKLIEKYSSIK